MTLETSLTRLDGSIGAEPAQSQMSPGQSSVGNPLQPYLTGRARKCCPMTSFSERNNNLWQNGSITYDEYADIVAIYDRRLWKGE